MKQCFYSSCSKQQLKMVTVGYYRYCLFCCVLLCAILELTSGATNCTVEIMNSFGQIDCSVWENVPNNTLVFDAVEIDSRFTRNLRYKIIDAFGENIKPQHFDIISPKRLHKGSGCAMVNCELGEILIVKICPVYKIVGSQSHGGFT